MKSTMKTRRDDFLLGREIFKEEHRGLSCAAFALHVYISYKTQVEDGNITEWKIITDKEIAKDCNMSFSKTRRTKKELIDSGLVEIKQMRIPGTDRHATAYHIPEFDMLRGGDK